MKRNKKHRVTAKRLLANLLALLLLGLGVWGLRLVPLTSAAVKGETTVAAASAPSSISTNDPAAENRISSVPASAEAAGQVQRSTEVTTTGRSATTNPPKTATPSTASATASSSKPAATTPSPAPGPTPSPPPAPANSEIASEADCPGQGNKDNTAAVLVCMSTYARAYNKLGAVNAQAQLMEAATAKAQDLKDCGFSHTACGRPFDYWMKAKGYTIGCNAENIAWGQKTPGDVFKAWMNSEGHRKNILGSTYKDIGVAVLNTSSGPAWVMQLGGC